jgi:hypothetical protein
MNDFVEELEGAGMFLLLPQEGSSVAIPCKAAGHPPPVITWKATYGRDQIDEEGEQSQ